MFPQLGHPAVAVELKAVRPIAYPLTLTLNVAHKDNQVYIYFIQKLLRVLKTVIC